MVSVSFATTESEYVAPDTSPDSFRVSPPPFSVVVLPSPRYCEVALIADQETRMVSLPLPPKTLSFPEVASIVSLPSSPDSVSLPAPPISTLLAPSPVKLSLKAPPVRFSIPLNVSPLASFRLPTPVVRLAVTAAPAVA